MTDNADRRSSQRFSLHLPVKCRSIEAWALAERAVFSESLNISSKGLVLAATKGFQPGQMIEASIEWPVRLDGSAGLTLVVQGAVVRQNNDQTAMRIEKYQFRTRKAGTASQRNDDIRMGQADGQNSKEEKGSGL